MSTARPGSPGVDAPPGPPADGPGERGRVDPKRFGADAGATAAVGLFIYGLSILTGPILARGLGPAGRGDLAAVITPTAMVGWLLTFGIPYAAVYYAKHQRRRSVVMAAWVFSIVVGGSVTALAWGLVPTFLADHDPSVTVPWFRALLVANVGVLPAVTATNLALADGRTRLYNALRALPFVANTTFLVVLAAAGRLTLTTALAAAFAANVVQYVVTLSVTRSWPGRGFERAVALVQYRYGAKVFVGSIAGFVVTRFDQFLLVGLVPSRELGLYAVAVNAAGVSSPVAMAVANVLFPHVRQAANVADGQRTTGQALRWTFASSAGIALLVGLLAPWVVPAFFGGEFRDSVLPLWLLLPGQVLTDVGNVFGSKLNADGRPGLASQGVGLGAACTVALIWPAVHHFGIEGAAVVTTVSQLAFFAFVAVASRRVTAAMLRAEADRGGGAGGGGPGRPGPAPTTPGAGPARSDGQRRR